MAALADWKSATQQVGNPMPLGFGTVKRVLYLSETFVPEGHATIAQRFNVGGSAGRTF